MSTYGKCWSCRRWAPDGPKASRGRCLRIRHRRAAVSSCGHWHPLFRELNELRRHVDRKYLRVSSVYKLLKREVIDRPRAMELLAQRHTDKEMETLRATVEGWFAWPLKHLNAH